VATVTSLPDRIKQRLVDLIEILLFLFLISEDKIRCGKGPQPENRLTRALVSALSNDLALLNKFIHWANGHTTHFAVVHR